MHMPRLPANESERLAALQRLNVLDTPPAAELDRLTRLAQRIFKVRSVLLTLIDARRQWFKSRAGLEVSETARDISFCGHAILQPQVLLVADARQDPRFADNPLVTAAPHIMFYAGQPLFSRDGHALGTLCLLDDRPRQLDADELQTLQDLAHMAEQYLQGLAPSQQLPAELEQCVQQRTLALETALAQLQQEIAQRSSDESALLAEKEHFHATLENTTDAFIEIDGQGLVVSWNRAAENTFGWTQEEAIGNNLAGLIIPPPLRAAHHAGLSRFVRTGQPRRMLGQRVEVSACHKDGHTFPIEMTLSAIHSQGRVLINGFLHDISQRKADEAEILDSRTRIKMIADNVPAVIAYIDTGLHYRFVNLGYEKWFGWKADTITGSKVSDVLDQQSYAVAQPHFDKVLRGEQSEYEVQMPSLHGKIWVHVTLIPHYNPQRQLQGFYLLGVDITERKQLQDQLQFEAYHDSLTGLPNRRALMQNLREAMARSRRSGKSMALLFFDLDGFKTLNDNHGHDFGDMVLQRFARELHDTVRETDSAARLAGDEFTIILENLGQPQEDSALVAGKLLLQIATIRNIAGVAVTLSSSIGIALYDGSHDSSANALLNAADQAMYQAKRAGKNRLAFYGDHTS
ncbi:diguanylate cyclase domain-containing protein [Vogesella fluminis]|uniref:Sensor domain-containing diguanylate cyclase n=1 Tax=Vogesella fluminis TaxID=1069161 RepID=A0ABQ3HC19_9NEIS|nr:diguanylate cyclase [Vogesella fluminis]GHD75056.1 sensor domain-containing diguanylate cyclase [Vogesella fluminis]